MQRTDTLQLLQRTPHDSEADAMAQLLRNGLAVSSFAVLEDFLKSRTAEVFARLSGTPLPFQHLPELLQEMAMERVVLALGSQVERQSRDGDPKPLIRSVGTSLGSTSGVSYSLSPLGFGHRKSNVGHADIKEVLRAFNVRDPWTSASAFAARLGLGTIGLQEAFRNANRRRNQGAHVAAAETPLGELQNYPREALAIAAGFDVLMSRAAFRLLAGDLNFAQGGFTLTGEQVGIRYVEFDGTYYREVRERSRRAAARTMNRGAAFHDAFKRASQDGSVVVYRESGITRSWQPTDLEPGRP